MKKFIALNIFLAAAIICCPGFGVLQPQQGGITASIKRGNEVYQQTCLVCHQANGGGVPGMNPPLIKTKWVLGDKKELIGIVLNGLTGEIEVDGETYQNNMPGHKDMLTDQQVADVLTFVRNSFGNKAGAVSPVEVKAVRSKIKKA